MRSPADEIFYCPIARSGFPALGNVEDDFPGSFGVLDNSAYLRFWVRERFSVTLR